MLSEIVAHGSKNRYGEKSKIVKIFR